MIILYLFFILAKISENTASSKIEMAANSALFCSNGIVVESDCYIFENKAVTFAKSDLICSDSGGHSISIHDEYNNQYFQMLAQQQFNDSSVDQMWIGLNQMVDPGTWEWMDNTDYNYTNWEHGEPRNDTDINCAVLSLLNGKWKTDKCSQLYPFICRIVEDDYTESSTSSPLGPYIPCKSWISFGIDDSSNFDDNFFTIQKNFVSTEVGAITHPERIHIHGVHEEYVEWNSKLNNQQIQKKIDDAYQLGMYSLSGQLSFLIIKKQVLQNNDNMNFAALLFVSDTSDLALQGSAPYIKDLQDVYLTFILLGNDSDSKRLTNYSTNFIYWRDLMQPQPEDWNSLSNDVFGCEELSTTTDLLPSSIGSSTTVSVTNSSLLTTTTTSTTSTSSLYITSPENKKDNTFPKWIYVVCGSLTVTILVCLIIFGCYRRQRQHYAQKRRESIEEKSRQMFEEKIEASPLDARLSTEERRNYYRDKKWIHYDCNEIVGKGASAVVYKGNLLIDEKNKHKNHAISFNENCIVALKIPINFVTNEDIEEFVRELDALINIGSHPNITKFYGWTLQQQAPVLITELAQTDLLQFVRNFRGNELPIKKLLSILWQITLALEHIASLSMVHRDVACRNILLTEGGVAKLTDFGLCCHCDESFTYRASLHKRLPLKWCSIEALVDRIFSEKSDVWSFGVLCYETFSYGAVPFPALSNAEMLETLQSGQRLEKPVKAPDELYELMLKCWHEKPSERPSFKELSECFKIWLKNETSGYGYLTLDILTDNKKNDIVDEIVET